MIPGTNVQSQSCMLLPRGSGQGGESSAASCRAGQRRIRENRVYVTSLGHAGLKAESTYATVLFDPWVSPYGAYQASWFQYPENSHLLASSSLFKPTAVVISHEHPDHWDEWFLRRLAPDVPVIIPRYPSPQMRTKILRSGQRRIVEVPEWERVCVAPGADVFFVSEVSPMNHDSGVVLVADGHTLLNLNDARLTPHQLRRIASVCGHVDVLALQGSGASWHPMCYEFPLEKRREISCRKRTAKLRFAEKVIQLVDPTVVLPFAGPPCFLDPELFVHNSEMDSGVFPDQEQVKEWLCGRGETRGRVLLPGDAWDVAAKTAHRDALWSGFSLSGDRRAYLERYAQDRSSVVQALRSDFPPPATSVWDRFRSYFATLLQLSRYFNDKISMRVGFDIRGPGGGSWAVDFRPGFRGVYDELGQCSYVYRFDSRWLPPILDGELPWEDFLLSLRFSAWRDPDVNNDHLLGLLKFAEPEALGAVERYETEVEGQEQFTINVDGLVYRVQRRCPHAGADLAEQSEVLPGGTLRCLSHYYEYSLATGECLNGVTPRLDVRTEGSEVLP